MSTRPIQCGDVAFRERSIAFKFYKVECRHQNAPGEPEVAVELRSHGEAICRSFSNAHGESPPFRPWAIEDGNVRSRQGGSEIRIKNVSSLGSQPLSLAPLMLETGVTVALWCQATGCRANSRVQPVKLARAMDRLAERADRLGEGAFPVDWLVREVERLSKEHPREDPYWDDAVAVYRVLDHAADLAFEDEIERARLRELREELRQEDMEWY